jgi:hypothetical protein
MLGGTVEAGDPERAMRRQILAFLEEHFRGMTLRDAGEWYLEAFPDGTGSWEPRRP